MNKQVNASELKSTEGKVRFLSRMIEKMEGELDEAVGKRKAALLKLIRMSEKRLLDLRMLH